MKWKQFLKPVKSMDTDEAHKFIEDRSTEDLTVLDVRQPNEYKRGHIPGAKLIPLPELDGRLNEMDAGKPTVVYCAIGGRSRVAAQLLAGKGFDNVINLSGGFKAWNGEAAFGDEAQGFEFFSGDETPEHTLAVAYALEAGLFHFYMSMASRVNDDSAKDLFKKLAKIEAKHQDKVYREYERVAETPLSREEFVNKEVSVAVEGGLTTEEYAAMYHPDWESLRDITSIAMSIEAQALDLYQRTSENTTNPESKKALAHLADEERAHLKELGKLMDNFP